MRERDILDKLHKGKWINDFSVNICRLFVLFLASPGSRLQEQQHAYQWGLYSDDP